MIARSYRAGRICGRVLIALGFALAVALGPTGTSYAATDPYPATGGAASAWKCTDTATDDTPPVTGSTCAVTAWGENPEPPSDEPAPGSSTVSLSDDQFQVISFGLGLALLVGGARLVGGWSR